MDQIVSATPHLGDFVVVVGRTSTDLSQAVPQGVWPSLGGPTGPKVSYVRPDAQFTVAWSGDAVFTKQDRSIGIGLYHLVPNHQSANTNAVQVQDQLLATFRRQEKVGLEGLFGKYGFILWDAERATLLAGSDTFHTYPLFYHRTAEGFVCGTDLRLVRAAAGLGSNLDHQALYHYLNFAYVPAPSTIFEGIRKLLPGSQLEYRNGNLQVTRYWQPLYPEDLSGSEHELTDGLRDKIVETVQRYRPSDAVQWGTFLSGGTDSSSITGILAQQRADRKVASFSIGFGEADYDELEYARIAAKAFAVDAHMRDVDAQDTMDLIPWLVRTYDEPYANSSAIPTAYCARLAHEAGISVMIAGDGGDEIYGGNERYAKDKVMGWYYNLPTLVKWGGYGVERAMAPIDVRLLNKVKNFIHRSSLPNPDRFYTDDSFASDHFEELLVPGFRRDIDVASSLDLMRELYRDTAADSELHRLMYIDLMMAIAENDLVKVNRTAKATGVSVLYPYLDRDLIEFTGRIGAKWKVKHLTKRYLFKRAMDGILPPEILAKKKQGFGLPIGVWFREHQGFRELLNDTLLSQRAQERGYFERDFIKSIVQRHQQGVWDYTQELWLMLMLELWHREHLDG